MFLLNDLAITKNFFCVLSSSSKCVCLSKTNYAYNMAENLHKWHGYVQTLQIEMVRIHVYRVRFTNSGMCRIYLVGCIITQPSSVSKIFLCSILPIFFYVATGHIFWRFNLQDSFGHFCSFPKAPIVLPQILKQLVFFYLPGHLCSE